MNWSKIKNIMIFFLTAMNIFMISFIAVTTFRESVVPSEVISASSQVLKKDNFLCDNTLIPQKRYTLPHLEAKFYTASELSDLFFGKQLAFRTVENSLIAKENKASLTVSSNHFLFESGYSSDNSFSSSKIKRALKKIGIDMKNCIYDEKEARFLYMYKNICLNDMYIDARLDADGEICYISAQWPYLLKSLREENFSFSEYVTKVKSAFPEGGKIDSVEPVYALSSSANKYIFSPAWRVSVGGDGRIIK